MAKPSTSLGRRLLSIIRRKPPVTRGQKVGQAMKRALDASGPAMVVMGASVGTLGALSGLSKLYEMSTRERDFQSAVREAPSLRTKQARARKHFNTIRRLHPGLSKDPMVAAGYIQKAMAFEQEGIDPSVALSVVRPGDKREGGIADVTRLAAVHSKLMPEV